MKHLLIAATVLLATPAQAYQVLPSLYAKTYCELRELGVSNEDAIAAAVRESVVSGPDAPEVTVNGSKVRSDILLAVRYANNQCPGLSR
jgi:hypothetical protein